ncbi:MAG TPA: hypothetical protein VEL79_14850 [Vicinamibacterales bacterium]|nr:hypothetical protein [Vicinamibacterales bacterium]
MATVIVETAGTHTLTRPAGAHDRLFYGGTAVALAAIALTGFASTYYLRFFDGGPRATISGGPFTALVHLHGALFSAWVALFVVQTALISSRRVAVHRRLGVFGGALGMAMIVVGTFTAIALARRGGAPPGIGPLEFLAVPLFDMVMFATFLVGALAWRRHKETHKRLMLLAYASILAAPIARLPGVLSLGPLAFYGLAFLVVIAGALYDYLSRGRVHQVYIWGGALLFVSVPLRLALSSTAAWRGFAQFLIR